MIISWYLQENGEHDYLDDDSNYVFTNVPKKDIADNDANGLNENDDGYVGIDGDEDEDEDKDEDDDDGSHWCYYWYSGCFFLSPCF